MKKKFFILLGISVASQMLLGLTNSLKTFYVGVEVSELLQNNFQNLGFQNMTFFLVRKGWGRRLSSGIDFLTSVWN